jgi:valyl-tRNA synthetase
MGIAPAVQTPLVLVAPSPATAQAARQWSETIKRLARVETIEVADVAPPGSLQRLVRGAVAALPLAGLVDLKADGARLERELAKERQELAKVEAKLANADFIARAPEEVVEEHQERRETFVNRIDKLENARARLSRL